ncbi:uncharacterized protein Z518_03232 [Rhinocladiella mackenziei CBS 650.93]|uniref:Alpha-1,3-mannosyltransferase n=1 Tax=Rhinocladiella mackenziei CBS 650.93 TaxID=1442369 RepID=A0A0D2IYX4_9EURO|nr:uncharacterized protein Z518_03232 [Rhinocladiella mackenziei CBS 650.93]KIX08576.1 hypothetical protein Z518_03232 [Rhinocladiella mackenziei CBS 650.93]
MPPHLHPRSTATSTLFAGTLLASFVVVGIPHLFPCPRPRTGYADTEIQFDDEGRPVRRRTGKRNTPEDSSISSGGQEQVYHGTEWLQARSGRIGRNLVESKNLEDEAELFRELQREAEALEKNARECPVPKPKGMVGRLLGFEEKRPEFGDEKS